MRQNICGILCALCSQVGHMRKKVIIMSDSKAQKIEWFRVMDIKNVILLTNTFVSLWFLSWNPSWSSVNERVPNYRNTQTPSCNRSPITARTSWSRWSTLWRSPADRTGSRSSLFLLLLPFLLCFTWFHRMPAHKLSYPHPHAQIKGQTHTGKTDSSQVERTLGLASGCGNGGLSFCPPLPPHSTPLHRHNPVYTHINMGKEKPKEGNGRQGSLVL